MFSLEALRISSLCLLKWVYNENDLISIYFNLVKYYQNNMILLLLFFQVDKGYCYIYLNNFSWKEVKFELCLMKDVIVAILMKFEAAEIILPNCFNNRKYTSNLVRFLFDTLKKCLTFGLVYSISGINFLIASEKNEL